MATFIKIPDFVEAGMEGFLDLSGTTTIKISLSNTLPATDTTTASGGGIKANITEIVYTNYSDSLSTDRQLESVTSNESGGTFTFDCADFTITAVTGALPTWRYLYVWDDASVTPTDAIIGLWDHGSAIDLALGETANININGSGLLTIA